LVEEKKKKDSLTSFVVAIWIIVGLLIIIVVGFLFYNNSLQNASVGDSMQVEVDEEAPDFTIQDLQGNPVTLSELRGKVVILNFWATWCGPCVEEMPMLTRYQAQHPEIVLVGINEEEGADKVQDFLDQNAFNYMMLLDLHTDVAKKYRIMTLPTTIIIDEYGFQRFQHIGIITEKQLDAYLEGLIVSE